MVPHPLFAQAALEYINISFDTFSSIAFLIAFFTRLTNLFLDNLEKHLANPGSKVTI